MGARVQVLSLLVAILAYGFAWANDPVAKAAVPLDIHIGDGYQLAKDSDALYALIEKSRQGWTVKAVDKTLPSVTNPETQEILIFSRNLSIVEPAFGEYTKSWKSAKVAPDFVCRSGDKGKRPAYNPCDSSLTDEHAPVMATLANIISFGGASLDGAGLRSLRRVKTDAVRLALESSGALEAVKSAFPPPARKRAEPVGTRVPNAQAPLTQQQDLDNAISSADLQRFIDRYAENDPGGLIPEARLRKYRKDYFAANTSEELETFIRAYADNDPEGYVAKAKAQLPAAKARDHAAVLDAYRDEYSRATTSAALRAFIDRYSQADPEGLVVKARKRLDQVAREEVEAEKRSHEEWRREATRREQDERKDALRRASEERGRSARLDSWRKALKVGDDTNCGPVLENRGAMIKVYLPSGVSSKEHWAKRDQIFPADAESCAIRDDGGAMAVASKTTVRDTRIGQKLCKKFVGRAFQTVQYAGRNFRVDEKHGYFTVAGYVEDTANGRLQIRIGSIRALIMEPTAHEVEIDDLEDQPGVRKGGIIWDTADAWKGC